MVVLEYEVTFIYALADPRDQRVMYVGKSNTPFGRVKDHLYDNVNPRKIAWIKELKELGLLPVVSVLERVVLAESRWQDAEKKWIEFYGGCEVLLNETTGGNAPIMSASVRRRISASHMGITQSVESRAKISSNRRGKGVGSRCSKAKLTEEIVALIKSTDAPSADLATKYSVAVDCINRIRSGATWRHVDVLIKKGKRKFAKGEKHGFSKLTEAQARQIKFSREPVKKLAQTFSVSAATIESIRYGYHWKHVTAENVSSL